MADGYIPVSLISHQIQYFFLLCPAISQTPFYSETAFNIVGLSILKFTSSEYKKWLPGYNISICIYFIIKLKRWVYVLPVLLLGWGRGDGQSEKNLVLGRRRRKKEKFPYSQKLSFSIIYTCKWEKMNREQRNMIG